MTDDSRFLEVFNLVEAHVESRYDIPVSIRDVPHPFTGDLDGAQIQVDYDLSPEEACFILLHLFGHTVQWNVNDRYREIGRLGLVTDPSPELLDELSTYEKQACQYSVQLLRELGIEDLDQWLSDYSHCDLRYLLHFYKTGEKKPFRDFFESGQECMTPLPIPDFTPTKWVFRFDSGIVV